jgi:hypothetical protein
MSTEGPPLATVCTLENAAFCALGPPLFRRADSDGAPAMVVRLGERDAAIPLRAMQREFGIADDSEDGRMLALIAQALDFVTGLRPGDELPPEVLTGEASWSPDDVHRRIAAMRVQLALIDWLRPERATGGGREMTESAILRAEHDPLIRAQIQEAFARAAGELGLPGPQDVVGLVEELAHELGYIEALRHRLLRPVELMATRLGQVARAWRGTGGRSDTLMQVRRLTGIALRQLAERFADLDARTDAVITALRDIESQRAFIRINRDWLYRSQRAWQPILDAWCAPDLPEDEALPPLLSRSYRFLAQRTLPAQEWTLMAGFARRRKVPERAQMVW